MSDAVSQHLLVISSEKKDEIANLQLLLSEGSAALDPMGTPRPSVSWRAVGAIEDEERRIARIPGSDAVLTGMPPMPVSMPGACIRAPTPRTTCSNASSQRPSPGLSMTARGGDDNNVSKSGLRDQFTGEGAKLLAIGPDGDPSSNLP